LASSPFEGGIKNVGGMWQSSPAEANSFTEPPQLNKTRSGGFCAVHCFGADTATFDDSRGGGAIAEPQVLVKSVLEIPSIRR
jgi:hypothetical protein